MTTQYDYYEVTGKINGELEVLFGSYEKPDCEAELDAEKATYKADGYTYLKITKRLVDEKPDEEVYENLIEGLSKEDAYDKLAELGYKYKEATKYYKANNSNVRGAKTGGYGDVLKYLEEAPRTEDDLYTFILENGTGNEARWVTARNAIRLLTISIYKKAGLDFTEIKAGDALKASVKTKGLSKAQLAALASK